MQINKKQYEMLLKMSYIANWVISDSEILSEAEMQKYENLQEFLCNEAIAAGHKELVTGTGKDASLAWNFGEECDKLIEEYNDYNFWEELRTRLSERDVKKANKKDWNNQISVKDNTLKIIQAESIWEEEFEKHGINRLEIKS